MHYFFFFFFYSPVANNKNNKLYVGYSLINNNNNIVQSPELFFFFFCCRFWLYTTELLGCLAAATRHARLAPSVCSANRKYPSICCEKPRRGVGHGEMYTKHLYSGGQVLYKPSPLKKRWKNAKDNCRNLSHRAPFLKP